MSVSRRHVAALVGGLVRIVPHAELRAPGELAVSGSAALLARDLRWPLRPLAGLCEVASQVESTLEAVVAGLADEVVTGQIVSYG